MKGPVVALALTFLLYVCHVDAIKMVCPEPSEIAPVKCSRTDNEDEGTSKTSLLFNSDLKSVDELETIVQKIRSATGAEPGQTVDIDDVSFLNLGDNIEEIDLTVFQQNNVTNLVVTGKFSQITGGEKDALQIANFFVINSPGFAQNNLEIALTGFSAASLRTLYLQNVDLVGFPKALSTLTELRTLYIINGTVSSIETDQFQNNPNMVWVYLYNTGLSEIQEGAFRFNVELRTEKALYALLAVHPQLVDENIHPNNGLADVDGIAMVSLTQTGVRSLSQDNWEGYLRQKYHFLMLNNNPLQCSPAMKWLKADKKRLQRQVTSANCANDKGKNVFNSKLV